MFTESVSEGGKKEMNNLLFKCLSTNTGEPRCSTEYHFYSGKVTTICTGVEMCCSLSQIAIFSGQFGLSVARARRWIKN